MAEFPLVYEVEIAGRQYQTRRVKGTEGLSQPFRFELSFFVPADDAFDTDAVVGEIGFLTLVREGEVRRISGVVTRAARRATLARERAGEGEVLLVLESRLATLRHRTDIRLFRDKTSAQIVTEVLENLGIAVEQRLTGSYAVRPYTVQFRETDLNFASRLLEDDGIFYFISADDSVVLSDSQAAYDVPLAVLPFRPALGLDTNGDAIHSIGVAGAMTAGKVSLRDFNHERPSLNMDVEAASPCTTGAEFYDYPGEYQLPAEGQSKAKLRALALACQFSRVVGRSFAGWLRPGIRFGLSMAPPGVDDGGYVVTRVHHDWAQADGSAKQSVAFDLGFEAQPDAVTFRPSVVTPAPVQPNPLTGFVTGPPGADIHCNQWGDVKVHFHWDRQSPMDDGCSHWIPVLQENAGHSSSVPRTGWEVLCQFLEGDLDRPFAVGRVYNPSDPHYSPLPEMKHRTALRSQTSPRKLDGQPTGENFIQMDDLAGSEAISIHAQRDQTIITGNDKSEQIDNTESVVVRGHETHAIGRQRRIAAALDFMPDVGGNQSKTVAANRDVKVGTSYGETVEMSHRLNIAGNHFRRLGGGDNVGVQRNLTETVGGVALEGSLLGNHSLAVSRTLIVGGAVFEVARKGKTEGSGKRRLELVGGLDMVNAKNRIDSRIEQMRSTIVGGLLKITSLKKTLITGMKKLGVRAGSISLDGTIVTMKVGSTIMTIKDGVIAINAERAIKIQTAEKNQLGADATTQI